MITRLDPDILECEVKWVLGSITINKASKGLLNGMLLNGILVELFQVLKDDVVSFTQYASKSGKLSRGQGLEKVSFHSNPKESQCQRILKLPHNCTHLTR